MFRNEIINYVIFLENAEERGGGEQIKLFVTIDFFHIVKEDSRSNISRSNATTKSESVITR